MSVRHLAGATAVAVLLFSAIAHAATPGTMTPASAASSPVSAPPAATSLDDLSNSDSGFYDGAREQGEEGGIRQRTLAEGARGVGIRGGYADEARRINDALERQFAGRLDRRFAFGTLMLRGGTVAPPVVTIMTSVEETSGDTFLYTSVGAYEIVKDARVAIKTPTWREYLTLPVTEPTPPQRACRRRPATRRICGALPSRRGGSAASRKHARNSSRRSTASSATTTAWCGIAISRAKGSCPPPRSPTAEPDTAPPPMAVVPLSTKPRSASP